MLPDLQTSRFIPEPGNRVTVEVPAPDVARVLASVIAVDALTYGDYDQVAFTSAGGVQQFRSLPQGRNPATDAAVQVPCVQLSFFIAGAPDHLTRVIEAVYDAHPYEEPVITVASVLRCLHVRGLDEDNPNRFWNRPVADWVPQEHR